MDFFARGLITVGGIGTIVAVSTVCLFLIWVVLPLFLPASLHKSQDFQVAWGETAPLHVAVDEYRVLGWSLSPSGSLRTFRADDGTVIDERPIVDGAKLSAFAKVVERPEVALGFEDGSIRLGTIKFASSFVDGETLPEELRSLAAGQMAVHEKGVIERTVQGQLRAQSVEVQVAAMPLAASSSAVTQLDQAMTSSARLVCTLSEDGKVRLHSIRETKNLLDETQVNYEIDQSIDVPVDPPGGDSSATAAPRFVRLSGRGDQLYVAWDDGRLLRFALADPAKPVLAEEADLVEDGQSKLTKLDFLLGGATLIAGDSRGNVTGSFLIHAPDAGTADGKQRVVAHRFAGSGAAVTSFGISSRSRMLAAGFSDGSFEVFYVPGDRRVVRHADATGKPIDNLLLAAKDDGVFSIAGNNIAAFEFDPKYPEASLGTLFGKVWYEGYPKPEHVWQSSGGTEDFEKKLSLVPLVFGTLKATFYCMMFGIPIAMLAAIYTSEFLHPRVKAKIKPTIELMASLPSVVLGFLAALVLAPFVRDAIPAILSSLVTIPLTLLVAAHLWQMLPHQLEARLVKYRFGIICALLPVGVLAGFWTGPLVERWLFSGNLIVWLNGGVGTGTGGWMLLLLPLSGIAAAVLVNRYATPWLVRRSASLNRRMFASLNGLKFLVGSLLALGIALTASWLLTVIGWDPRGSYIDTYDQRNSLIVGFVMGFAVVPLIYTLADDALTSVPEQLRAASLGAGATPWQTATRIVIPTAMSGLFSAVMVGLGRAVGETMIVLMAGGNIPVMETNIFNGFRTLSANIAVELPEAVRNSTHYRTLFLAALTLFLLTFLVNTIAELVRLRFRRRVYQL